MKKALRKKTKQVVRKVAKKPVKKMANVEEKKGRRSRKESMRKTEFPLISDSAEQSVEQSDEKEFSLPSGAAQSAAKKIKNLSKLIADGKKKGFLTFDELNNALPEDVVTSEEIDEILTVLDGENIEVVDSEDDVAPEPKEEEDDDLKSSDSIAITESTPTYVEDPVRMYLRQMGQIPLLSREEELNLAKEIERAELMYRKAVLGCPVARYKVLTVANQIFNKEVNVEDVIRDEFRMKYSKLMGRVSRLTARLRTVRKPESLLDIPVDFDKLTEIGSMMGSGGMIVMDETTCMVDIARYFIDFLEFESCGKCVPCREGVQRMNEILQDICDGKGKAGDIELLDSMSQGRVDGALCALGSTAANPILSTLKYFRDEYVAHVRDKKCPAGVCKALIRFSIDKDKCTGCGVCLKKCPSECISGEKKKVHVIDQTKCIKCGVCKESCKFDAIIVE